MKKLISSTVIIFIAISISSAQSNKTEPKNYSDKFELSLDILNAIKNHDIGKIKLIAHSLTLPYSLFKKQQQTISTQSPLEISLTSWYGKDSILYNNFASDFYFGNFIQSVLNETDNDISFGKNIYVIFGKSETKKNNLEQQNFIEILYDNNEQIKVIKLDALTTINHQLYSLRQASYHSFNKKNLSKDLLKKTTAKFEVYTLENNNFKLYKNDNLEFDNLFFKKEIKKNDITNLKEKDTILEKTQVIESEKDPDIFENVDEMPEYSGGANKLLLYLKENLHYPKAAQKNKIEGVVVVRFIIDNKGSIINPVVIKDATNGYCTDEAIRLVKNMPKWWPGKQNGKAVKVYYTLAIPFKLK